MKKDLDIAFVTDEVSRNIEESLNICRGWGISLFELREGSERRTPYLTAHEVSCIENEIRSGARITALSPGIFKQPVEHEAAIREDLERTLPETIELAQRFGCRTIIVFGFEKEGEAPSSRLKAQKNFADAAEVAAQAGIVLAIENEPEFWIDQPADAVAMLDEIGHPGLRVNWDPANMHWGGMTPTEEDLNVIAPYLHNLHIKDYYPADPGAPWRPIGEGTTPWQELLEAVVEKRSQGELGIEHVTIETHCEPLFESSEKSLENLRTMLNKIQTAV